MREHDAFDLLADDTVALTDLPALAAARGWSLMTIEEGAFHRFRFEMDADEGGC
jgi:hypothetical protein